MRFFLAACIAGFALGVVAANGKTAPKNNKRDPCSCTQPDGKLGDYCCDSSADRRKRCRENVTDVCKWEDTTELCNDADPSCQ